MGNEYILVYEGKQALAAVDGKEDLLVRRWAFMLNSVLSMVGTILLSGREGSLQ